MPPEPNESDGEVRLALQGATALILTGMHSGPIDDWVGSIRAAIQGTPGRIDWATSAHFVAIGEGALPWTCVALVSFDSVMSLRSFLSRDGLARLRSMARPLQIIAMRAREIAPIADWKMRLIKRLGIPFRLNFFRSRRSRGAEYFGPAPAQLRKLIALPRKESIAMVNYLGFRERAEYPPYVPERARLPDLSGEQAYALYRSAAIRGIYLLGGTLVFSGHVEQILHDEGPELVQGPWDCLSIVEYPSNAALFQLGRMPGLARGGDNRAAGLKRASSILTGSRLEPERAE